MMASRRRFFLWAGLVAVLLMMLAPAQANGVFIVAFGRYGTMALRSGNLIFAANDVSLNALVIVRCNDPACTSKLTTVADSTSANMGQYASMVLGPDGFPVVAYYDAANKRPRLLDCANVDCTSFVVRKDLAAISLTDLGQYMSLGLTPDGVATVAYYDATNKALEVVRCDTTACGVPVRTRVEAGNVGEYASMKITADQTPVIAYYNRNTKSLSLADCFTPTCSSRVVTTVDDTADPGDVGQWASLALGADGFPVISYYDVFNKDLKFVDCANMACTAKTITVVDSAGDVGSHLRVVVRPNGRPLIAYRDNTSDALKLADCEDFACTNRILTTIDSSGGGIGAFPSIAFRSDGTTVLSYSTVSGPPLYLHDIGNQTPVLNPVPTQTVAPGDTLTFTLTASDIDNRPVQTLTYAMYGQVPAGAALNPLTGVFTWTPTLADLGTYAVVFAVTDDGTPAKSAFVTGMITAAEFVPFNPPPVWTVPADFAVVLGETAGFTVSATDATTVTLSASGVPSGASFNANSGAFTWVTAAGQAGTYAVTFTAIDSGVPAASVSAVVVITVHDQLIINGGFETDLNADDIPDSWTRKKASGDVRVCGVGVGGGCAYKITGSKSEQSLLRQMLNVTWVDMGDSITLETDLRGTDAKVWAVVKLKITDNNGAVTVLKASLPNGTSAGYLSQVSPPLILSEPVQAMVVSLTYRQNRGSVLVDEVRVIVVNGGQDPTRADGLLPLP